MLRNCLRREVLNAFRYPREFPLGRNFSSQEKCESVRSPIDDECPRKKRCLMDLYPVPCGPWKEHYDANNAIYNRQLIAATGVFIFTVFVMNRIGWVKGYREVNLF